MDKKSRRFIGKSAAFRLGLCCTRAINPKAKCLSEITFRDAGKIEDCYLYRLAHHKNGLALFRHVVLVSSPRDKYVQRHSAAHSWRVQDQGFDEGAGDDGDGSRDSRAGAGEGDSVGERRDGPPPPAGAAAEGGRAEADVAVARRRPTSRKWAAASTSTSSLDARRT